MSLVFSLNGRETSVPIGLAKSLTLNEYLRTHTQFKGTKLSCGQGGCGVCTCAISRTEADGTVSTHPAASCLLPLIHVAGAAVTTTEGLQNGGPHPIQSRLAGLNGSQCGMCTPGQVMMMYSALSQLDGGKACSTEQLEKMDILAGNLCRCTGYRPLEETLLSFANDSKIEDKIMKNPIGSYESKKDPTFPTFLNSVQPLNVPWIPLSMDELLKAWNEVKGGEYQIVGGHTGWGVYGDQLSALQELDRAPGISSSRNVPVIHLRSVQDLKEVKESEGVLTIGSGVTIARLIRVLSDKSGFVEVRDHLHLIAGHQVRNVGTVAGNIMMARNLGFASDAAPVLCALNTTVSVLFADKDAPTTVLLFDFLQSREPCLLLSLSIPLVGSEGIRTFRSFRAASRARNAYPLLNSAFTLEVGQDGLITKATAIFGALGDRAPVRAIKLQEALQGQTLASLAARAPEFADAVLQEAAQWFPAEDTHRAYRLRLAQTFAFKLALSVSETPELGLSIHRVGARHSKHSSTFTESKEIKTEVGEEEHAYKASNLRTALAQATGEARYVDDANMMINSAFGACVPIPEANMSFASLDDSKAKEILGSQYIGMLSSVDLERLELPTVLEVPSQFIPVPDVPPSHANQQVFIKAGDKSRWAGEPVALVLATSSRAALRAAKLITINGMVPGRDNIQLDVNTAPPFPGLTNVVCHAGDVAKTEAMIRKHEEKGGIVINAPYKKNTQMHFYMETQTTHAAPSEDGALLVYTATQDLSGSHKAIAHGTGLPQNRVVVKTRRVGGGFGGKLSGQIPTNVRCALAAKVFNLPVRMTLDRATDMQNTGGRPELGGTIKVAVEASGKVVALVINLKVSVGALLGTGLMNAVMLGQNLDMCYDMPNVAITMEPVLLNHPPRNAVRGPGHTEATAVIEAVMDLICSVLRLPPEKVRQVNLVTDGFMKQVGLKGPLGLPAQLHDNPLSAMWPLLLERAGVAKRRAFVEDYNRSHRWTKRGLAVCPGKYMIVRTAGMPARIDVFPDGSIQIATSGVELGQGLQTKAAQIAATVLSKGLGVTIPLNKINFTEFSTDIIAAHHNTGGSTTSELVAMAIEAACNKLLEKFAASKKNLLAKAKASKKDKDASYTWQNLVQGAYTKADGLAGFLSFVELGEKACAQPALPELIYDVYGASVAEVELDVLTGENRVLGVTLMMDSGPLLNPAIDIGQVEGAFVMGLGQWLLEGANWDTKTGALISDNTWNYKLPTMYDIPQEFDVQLIDFQGQRATNGWSGAFAFAKMVAPMPYKPHNNEVRGYNRSSRALGEPPLLMSSAILSALRQAVSAARSPLDGSVDPQANFNMPVPASPEAVSELCWSGNLSSLLRATGSGPIEHVVEVSTQKNTRSKAKSVVIHAQKDGIKETASTKEQKEVSSKTADVEPQTPAASEPAAAPAEPVVASNELGTTETTAEIDKQKESSAEVGL